MKLMFDMASLRMRHYHRLNGNLFCTGDIETVSYCMEIYRQFLNNKRLDFFISGRWEIELALRNI